MMIGEQLSLIGIGEDSNAKVLRELETDLRMEAADFRKYMTICPWQPGCEACARHLVLADKLEQQANAIATLLATNKQ